MYGNIMFLFVYIELEEGGLSGVSLSKFVLKFIMGILGGWVSWG